jgi:hypothetical protein
VRPRFQRHPAARHPAEDFLHGLRCGRHFLFQNDFSRFIQNAVPTESISQIQPDRQFLTSLPVSFISLRLERVDNLGAYRIPPETGILIPSGFNRSQNSGRLREAKEILS